MTLTTCKAYVRSATKRNTIDMKTFNNYLEIVINHYKIRDKERLLSAISVCKSKDHLSVQEVLQMTESGLPIIKAISEIDNTGSTSVIDKIKTREIYYSFADFVTLIWHMACNANTPPPPKEKIITEWFDVNSRLPTLHTPVNVRLKDGRYSNSFIMSDKSWAYNIDPTHWSYIKE